MRGKKDLIDGKGQMSHPPVIAIQRGYFSNTDLLLMFKQMRKYEKKKKNNWKKLWPQKISSRNGLKGQENWSNYSFDTMTPRLGEMILNFFWK